MALRLSNISLADFRRYLKSVGCNRIRIESGHEIWAKAGMRRSITLQTHVDPIPERIVRQSLANLGVSREDFEQSMSNL